MSNSNNLDFPASYTGNMTYYYGPSNSTPNGGTPYPRPSPNVNPNMGTQPTANIDTGMGPQLTSNLNASMRPRSTTGASRNTQSNISYSLRDPRTVSGNNSSNTNGMETRPTSERNAVMGNRSTLNSVPHPQSSNDLDYGLPMASGYAPSKHNTNVGNAYTRPSTLAPNMTTNGQNPYANALYEESVYSKLQAPHSSGRNNEINHSNRVPPRSHPSGRPFVQNTTPAQSLQYNWVATGVSSNNDLVQNQPNFSGNIQNFGPYSNTNVTLPVTNSGPNGFAPQDNFQYEQPNNQTVFQNETRQSSTPEDAEQISIPDDDDDWVMPAPVRDYDGNIPDIVAFREARDARRRVNPMDEKEDGIVEKARGYALLIFNAFLQTDVVTDGPMRGGPAGAVNWIKNGHWDDDFIWRCSWKVVMDCHDLSEGAEYGVTVYDSVIKKGVRTKVAKNSIQTLDYPDFLTRLTEVHRLFYFSKKPCKNYFDAEAVPWQLRIVAAPELVEETKKKDTKGNNNRRPAHLQCEADQPKRKVARTTKNTTVSANPVPQRPVAARNNSVHRNLTNSYRQGPATNSEMVYPYPMPSVPQMHAGSSNSGHPNGNGGFIRAELPANLIFQSQGLSVPGSRGQEGRSAITTKSSGGYVEQVQGFYETPFPSNLQQGGNSNGLGMLDNRMSSVPQYLNVQQHQMLPQMSSNVSIPYDAQFYNGQPYNGQPYNGQPYNGQPYSGQPYSGQPYDGQIYNGQPYNGQQSRLSTPAGNPGSQNVAQGGPNQHQLHVFEHDNYSGTHRDLETDVSNTASIPNGHAISSDPVSRNRVTDESNIDAPNDSSSHAELDTDSLFGENGVADDPIYAGFEETGNQNLNIGPVDTEILPRQSENELHKEGADLHCDIDTPQPSYSPSHEASIGSLEAIPKNASPPTIPENDNGQNGHKSMEEILQEAHERFVGSNDDAGVSHEDGDFETLDEATQWMLQEPLLGLPDHGLDDGLEY